MYGFTIHSIVFIPSCAVLLQSFYAFAARSRIKIATGKQIPYRIYAILNTEFRYHYTVVEPTRAKRLKSCITSTELPDHNIMGQEVISESIVSILEEPDIML